LRSQFALTRRLLGFYAREMGGGGKGDEVPVEDVGGVQVLDAAEHLVNEITNVIVAEGLRGADAADVRGRSRRRERGGYIL
jgi:hypothetical protein